jgi:predicted Zn-dependent protease
MTHAMLAARARLLANPEVDSLRAALAQADGATLATMSPAQQAGVFYAAVMAAVGLREFGLAQRQLERLTPLAQGNARAQFQVRLLATELALAAGELRRARELVVAQEAPGASRALLFLRARTWTLSGQAREAAEQLQVWLASRPRDAQAWQLLSSAYAAQGRTVQAVRAEAEAHAARLDYGAARDRLQAAQTLLRQSATVDHIEASIIDARSRQIDSLLREQALER